MTTTAPRPVTSPQDLPLITRRGGAWGAFWAALVVVALAVLIVRDWAPLVDVDRGVLESVRLWALRNDWVLEPARLLSDLGASASRCGWPSQRCSCCSPDAATGRR